MKKNIKMGKCLVQVQIKEVRVKNGYTSKKAYAKILKK